jgi:hypothetical protein
MKKKLLILAAMLIVSVSALQAQAFEKGNNVLSFGIGFGSSIGSFNNRTQTPGLSVNFERGIVELGPGVLSAGGYVGYKGFRYSSGSYTQKWNYVIIGARAAYHYTGLKVEKLDVYGGLMLSYNILNYTDNYSGSGNIYSSGRNSAGVTAFVGGRYYLLPVLAAFSELGYGVSFVSVGVSFKFGK